MNLNIDNHIVLIGSLAVFAVVTALDVITTMIALNIGAVEANPIMQNIVMRPELFLLVKLCCIGLVAYIGWKIEQQAEGIGAIALVLASAVTTLAVSNNFGVIVSLI